MISKAMALRKMETSQPSGERIAFGIEFITANREDFRAKRNALKHLATLPEDSDQYAELKLKISKMDVGGRWIAHNNCVLSGARGMHAKKSAGGGVLSGEAAQARTLAPATMVKDPRNGANRTRNIVFRPGKTIRKFHNSLVFVYNNEEVIY